MLFKVIVNHFICDYLAVFFKVFAVVFHTDFKLCGKADIEVKLVNARESVYREPRNRSCCHRKKGYDCHKYNQPFSLFKWNFITDHFINNPVKKAHANTLLISTHLRQNIIVFYTLNAQFAILILRLSPFLDEFTRFSHFICAIF